MKECVVKLNEENSILSPEVVIGKLGASRDYFIEDVEGFSVEVTDSGTEMSRSISVGGAFLASPCSFLWESSRYTSASRLIVGNREESIVTTVPTVTTMEVASTKKAMSQRW